MRAPALHLTTAFCIAATAVFFGMFLPFPTNGAVHNPFWEFVFGIGFWLAELFPRVIGPRGDALIGFLLWPIAIFAAVWFLAFRTLCRGGWQRVILGAFFIVSIFLCVGNDIQNALGVYVPLWSNEYFVRY